MSHNTKLITACICITYYILVCIYFYIICYRISRSRIVIFIEDTNNSTPIKIFSI
nr:MAG TPA: hypothetical protein [Crassvirales sp.]DAG93443.1 MAG TPA: hypothetical protein [Crassvirales sp.]DAU06304.1 MAG TPA: hypothetical protein [Caudoviricetes sp.]